MTPESAHHASMEMAAMPAPVFTPGPDSPVSEPLTVRVGVTGHRSLKDPQRVAAGVAKILGILDRRMHGILRRYQVISPLAEGADRLVASEVLDWRGTIGRAGLFPAGLRVVLPMSQKEYYATFNEDRREDSIAEFEKLLALAGPPLVLHPGKDRKEAYEHVGRYVVENCDVLIAVWDGQPSRGRGGTAEVLDFARSGHCTVFWIHAETGAVEHFSKPHGFLERLGRAMTGYCGEALGEGSIYDETAQRLGKLKDSAREAGLDPAILNPLQDAILPNMTKASRLAQRYQNRYQRCGVAAYLLSAAAVAIAVCLWLFWREHHFLFLIEAADIVLVIALVRTPQFHEWQRKWLEYRYLAERLRVCCFLYVAGVDYEFYEPPPDLRVGWLSDPWVTKVLQQAWRKLPSPPAIASSSDARQSLAAFLVSAWIGDQIAYYERASRSNHSRGERIERILNGILLATLAAAVIHAFDWLHQVHSYLFLAAVVLPALASAFAGIAIFRHYQENAERYHGMSVRLTDIARRMAEVEPVPSLSELQRLVREADRCVSHEHHGWRMVFGTQLPGPG